MSENRTLATKRGVGASAWERKAGFIVKQDRFYGGEGRQAMKISPGEVEESMSG